MTRTTVRLLKEELAGMRGAFEKVLRNHSGAVVSLFGSRARAGSGGDIDLLISLARRPRDPLTLKLRLKQALEDALGERKIDIVLDHPEAGDDALIRLARKEGVVLWSHPRKS